jgi:4,4'-diaponeurosporenoate glycosyltransferase
MNIELLWVLIPWGLGFVLLGRMRPCPPLETQLPRASADPERVSVIVPARNERHRITPLLASLAAQDDPDLEIVVVDDGSTDGTAELARAWGAKTIEVSGPPTGWLGKPYACWVGAQHASGDLLVFLDADTALERGGLARIAATHARRGGLVSVLPYHRMVGAYERLSAFLLLVAVAGTRSFTLAGEAIRPSGGFGPCMACSREDYFRTGGHELVRGEVLDDVMLAQEMARRGVPTHNFVGRGTIAFRMYPEGLRDLANGWTKTFGRGATRADPASLILILGWMWGVAGALDVVRLWPAEGLSEHVVAALIGCLLFTLQIWWFLSRLGNYGPVTAFTYPISLVFFIGVLVRSLFLTLVRRRVRWKGRSIPVGSSG